MKVTSARLKAERLARRHASKPPVDVNQIASSLRLRVVYGELGPGVSGLLVSHGNSAQICVQQSDHKHRQRFTIAHEIAHHVLRHPFEAGEHVHVDRGNLVSHRGPRAAAGVDPTEIEANQFAASLLMPSAMVRDAVARCGGVVHTDRQITELASKFQVSEQAMTIRLISLRYL